MGPVKHGHFGEVVNLLRFFCECFIGIWDLETIYMGVCVFLWGGGGSSQYKCMFT